MNWSEYNSVFAVLYYGFIYAYAVNRIFDLSRTPHMISYSNHMILFFIVSLVVIFSLLLTVWSGIRFYSRLYKFNINKLFIIIISFLIILILLNNWSFRDMQPNLSYEYYFDYYKNPYNDSRWHKEKDTDVPFSYFGQGTWYVYGRIQELNVIDDIKLKTSKNRLSNIGLFYNDSATWIEDALSANYPVIDYNTFKYGIIDINVGDIALCPITTSDYRKTWYYISCVEEIVNKNIIVSTSNIVDRRGQYYNPRIPRTVQNVIITDVPQRFFKEGKPSQYGVYLYENPSDNSKLVTPQPLEKGDMFVIKNEKVVFEKEMFDKNLSKNIIVNRYWYDLLGYTKGKLVRGWAKLESRRDQLADLGTSMESNFCGIDFVGNKIGYHLDNNRFDVSDVKIILLGKHYLNNTSLSIEIIDNKYPSGDDMLIFKNKTYIQENAIITRHKEYYIDLELLSNICVVGYCETKEGIELITNPRIHNQGYKQYLINDSQLFLNSYGSSKFIRKINLIEEDSHLYIKLNDLKNEFEYNTKIDGDIVLINILIEEDFE